MDSSRVLRMARVAVLLAAGLVPSAALAQSPDPESAVLFEEAQDAFDKGDFPAACPKLLKVVEREPGALGARILLARCFDKLGRLASAHAACDELTPLAKAKGDARREKECRELSADLERRWATLTLVVPADVAASATLTRGGKDVPRAQWGKPIGVDPGSYEIILRVPGKAEWRTTAAVERNGRDVVIGVLGAVAAPPPKAASAAGGSWQLTLGATLLAAGGGNLIAGAVTGGLALAKNDESNKGLATGYCDAGTSACGPSGAPLRRDAGTLADVSTVAFIVGGVLAGAGVVLVATAPRPKEPARGSVGLRVGLGGVVLEGGFR